MTVARFLDRASRPATVQLGDVAAYGVGGLVGGIVGGAFVVVVTLLLKAMMDFFAGQATWLLIVVPLVGLLLSSVVLQGCGRSEGSRPASPWRTFPPRAVRADITGDIVDTAGQEERFPWRLALLRLVAIFATVGSGAAMGTEAPAAYLGVAAGACVGDRGRRWRRLLRPAAVGGGAAGVAALMGIPLVGTAYVLEIGRRNGAPYEASRVVPALIGGFVGWAISATYDLNLIRLVVPKWPPEDLVHALITVTLIGALSGGITSLAASALYRAKKWKASPAVRFAVGGPATASAAIALVIVAEPAAAFGPGGAAILWAETGTRLPLALLCVALLRAAMTTAAAAAGGCGGIFVPFLAVGDLAGRVFAPVLDLGGDIAGAAGAAGGIAGGYRLPLTAIAMVLGVGGPRAATLTCLGVVAVAFLTDKLNPFKR
jgi:CIC family chloride channel protein